jgi:hypothetical protein
MKKMKARHYLMISALLLMVAMGMTSCITCSRTIVLDDQTVEWRHLRNFERIEIIGSPTVVYTQADTFGVRIEGPENLIPRILTDTDNGTLYVRNKGKMGFINFTVGDKSDVTVYVSSPDLIGVLVSGSGDFISRKRVDTDTMNIVLRGSGDIQFENIICDASSMELVGSGDVCINHLDARKSTASLVGSGDINITQANVLDTDLSLRGSGDIVVNFLEGCRSAQCQLSGSGDITLTGTLTHYDSHKSGSGDIDTGDLRIRE